MFAVLYVSDFSLQAVLRLEHELASRPVALIDETRRPPVVVACTARAHAAGVEPGQTAPQAMARCAAVILRASQPDAETEARAGLIAAALSVSPQVEDTAPGVCTIHVGGLAGERRELALLAAVTQLRELGLVATAGLAATPLLALYAARYCGQMSGVEKVERDVQVGLVLQHGQADRTTSADDLWTAREGVGADLRAVRSVEASDGPPGGRALPALPRQHARTTRRSSLHSEVGA